MLRNIIWLILIFLPILTLLYAIPMPGESYRGTLPVLTHTEMEIQSQLREHISYIAGTIGERNLEHYQNLISTQNYIEKIFRDYGYEVKTHSYQARNKTVSNIEAKIIGTQFPDEIIIVGAHYDSVVGSPGADDNASGVAALLELARLFKDQKPKRSIYLLAFVNEEPPYFWTHAMGSWVYVKSLKQEKANVVAMFSIESIGYFSDKKRSQKYPIPLNFFYPREGNFIAFVGNLSSRNLVRKSVAMFRNTTQFPSEGIAAPAWVPGVSWSDQASFWRYRYPAVMVTDTVPFRNPHYHQASDLPDTLNYEHIARVVQGLANMVLGID